MDSPSSLSKKAAEDGQEILRKFSETKKRNNSGTKLDSSDLTSDNQTYSTVLFGDDSTDFDQPSFDRAVVDGGVLAQLYSAKKHHSSENHTPSSANYPSGNGHNHSEEAMLVLRQAQQQLEDLRRKSSDERNGSSCESPIEAQQGLPLLSQLLQDLEGHLEAEAATVSKQIIFSPSSSKASTASNRTPTVNGNFKSESTTPTSNTKEVLKVYMKNQLDLQESEWEAYEETFNTIAEQLDEARNEVETITAERDALLAQQGELKDAASETAADYERKYQDLQTKFEIKSRELAEELAVNKEELSAANADRSSLKDQLQSFGEEVRMLQMSLESERKNSNALEEALQKHQKKLKTAMTSPAILRHSPLKNNIHSESKEETVESNVFRLSTPSTPNPSDRGILQNYMQNQLELQEHEWADYEEMVNTVAEKLEETEQALEQSQSERDSLHKLNVELEAELVSLKSMISEKAAELSTSQSDYLLKLDQQRERFDGEVENFEKIISELQLQCSSKDENILDIQNKFDKLLQDKHAELNDVREYMESDIKNLEVELQNAKRVISDKDDDIYTMQKELESSRKEVTDNPSSVLIDNLKNEMDDIRTDKNNTEIELRIICTENDELKSKIELLSHDVSRLQSGLNERSDECVNLRMENESKTEEIFSLKSRLQEFEIEMSEDTKKRFEKLLQDKHAELNDVREYMESDIKNLEVELQNAKRVISDKDDDIYTMQKELESLRKEVTDNPSSVLIDNLKNEMDDIRTDKNNTEIELRIICTENDELKSKIELLSHDVSRLQSGLNERSDECVNLRMENESKTEEIFSLKSRLQEFEIEISADVKQLQSKLDEQSGEFNVLRVDNDGKSNKITSLQARVQNLEQELVGLTGVLSTTQSEYDALTKKLEESVEHQEKLTEDYEQLSKQYNEEVHLNEKLENELDHLKVKLDQSTFSPSRSRSKLEMDDADENLLLSLRNENTALAQRLENAINAKSQIENEMKQNVTMLNKQLQSLKPMLAEKEEIIRRCENMLIERDQLINEREDLLAERTAEFQRERQNSQSKLQNLSSTIEDMSQAIQNKDRRLLEVDDMSRRADELDSQIMSLKATLEQKEELLGANANTIESLTRRVSELEEIENNKTVSSTVVDSKFSERIQELESTNRSLNEAVASKDAIIIRMKTLFAQSLDPMSEHNFYGDTNFTQADADAVKLSSSKGSTPHSSPRNSPLKPPTPTSAQLRHSSGLVVLKDEQSSAFASLDDAERVIQAMEKKLRVQIHHLQSLQDTLSEEKRKSQYLADHKRQLLQKMSEMETKVRTLEDQIQEHKLHQLDLAHSESASQRALDDERAKSKALEVQLLESKTQLATNMALIDDLQNNNSKLRVAVEEKELGRFNSSEFRQEAKNEDDVVHLTTKYNSLRQELSELEAVNAALKANLEHKSEYAVSLVTDVNELRSLVTSKEDEIEALRASDLKEDANLRAQLLERERVIENLNDAIARLEENKIENELLLAERMQTLQNEQEINSQLRTFLTIIDEKESTTEELLYQIQMSESSMASQLSETCKLLVAEKEVSKKALAETAALKGELQTLKAEFDQIRSRHESEGAVAAEKAHFLENQLEASDKLVSDKNTELKSLGQQLDQLRKQVAKCEQDKAALELKHKNDGSFKTNFSKCVSMIVDEFNYAQNRLDQNAENLERSVIEWLDIYEERVHYLTGDAKKLQGAMKDQERCQHELRKELQMNKETHKLEIDKVVAGASSERSILEAKVSKLLHDHESMRNKLSDASASRHILRSPQRSAESEKPSSMHSNFDVEPWQSHHSDSLKDAFEDNHNSTVVKNVKEDHSLDFDLDSVGKSIGSYSQTHSLTEDFTKLTEKFEITEKRALEMSAQGARYFAKTAKGMALLEGENAKLRSLIDHFRIVNSKLMGDVYAANSTLAASSGLQQRHETLETQYLHLLESNRELEEKFATAEHQWKVAREEHQLLLEEKDDEFYNVMREERMKFNTVEESLSHAERTMSQLQDMNQLLEKKIEREKLIATEEIQRLNALITAERNNSKDSSNLVETLNAAIVELELGQEELRQTILANEVKHKAIIDEFEKSKKLLQESERNKSVRLLSVEKALDECKQQKMSDSNLLSEQSNHMEDLTEKIRFYEEEIAEYQRKADELERNFQAVTDRNAQQEEKINTLINYLDDARDEANVSSDKCSASEKKCLKVEEKMRQVLHAKETLEKTVEELSSRKDEALNSVTLHERRIEGLQNDLNQSRREIEICRSKVLDSNSEVNKVKANFDAREREVAAKANEITKLNEELTGLKAKVGRLSELEAVVASQSTDLRGIEQIESVLIGDIDTATSHFENKINSLRAALGHQFYGQEGHVEADDLLTTPLKSIFTPSRNALGVTYNQRSLEGSSGVLERFDYRSSETSHPGAVWVNLDRLRKYFSRFVQMVDEHLQHTTDMCNASKAKSTRLSEMEEKVKSLDHKLNHITSEKDAVQQKLESADSEIDSLNNELEALREERDNAIHAGEDHAQWLRLLRRDLESTMTLDAISSVVQVAQSHIRHSEHSATLSSVVSLSVIEQGHAYPLQDTVSELKSTVQSLINSLKSVNTILTQKSELCKKFERKLNVVQSDFEKDKRSLQDQFDELSDAHKQEKAKVLDISDKLNSFLAENDNLKAQNHELHQIRSELEDEIRTLKDTGKDLRHTLKDAEILCAELRSKVRHLLADKENLSADVTLLREESEISMRRITDLELQVEQNALTLGQVKAERDTLDNIKLQLTHELEVTKKDVAIATRENKPVLSNESMKASFELERLLAALGATLDHLQVTLQSKSDLSDSHHNETLKVIGDGINTEERGDKSDSALVGQRVEKAIKRLSTVRSWSRDERRNKRLADETILNLRSELEKLRLSTSQEAKDYRDTIEGLQTKEDQLLVRVSNLSSLEAQNAAYDKENAKLKKERDELSALVNQNKHEIHAADLSLQSKDLEISRLKQALDSDGDTLGDLKDTVMQLQSELESRQTLCDEQDSIIRGLKATSHRQKDSIERLEGVISRNKKEIEEMEKKLQLRSDGLDTESQENYLKLRALEAELRELKQSHRKKISALKEKLDAEEAENASALTTIVALEGKLQVATNEASFQKQELNTSRQELERLRDRIDKEVSEHRNTLSTLATIQTLEAKWRETSEEYQALKEEAESKLHGALGQLKAVTAELSDANVQKDKYRDESSNKANDVAKLQQSVDQLSSQLDRTRRELQNADTRGSALRAEGRQIRNEVVNAVNELNDVTNILHSLTKPGNNDSGDVNSFGLSSSSEESFGDTLGAKQLHQCIQEIHRYIHEIKTCPDDITSTQSALRKSETENDRLRRELESIESLHTDRVQRLHTEIQDLEYQLQSRADFVVGNDSSLTDKLVDLENELDAVKERAQSREEEFRKEVEILTLEKSRMDGVRNGLDKHFGQHENNNNSTNEFLEVESLKSQLNSAHNEIAAIRHHRSVLQSTVTELESLVYQEDSPDKNTSRNYSGIGASYDGSSYLSGALDDGENLSDENSHLKRRLSATEKLVNVYRTALLALYVDGSFYDTLPVNIGVRETDADGHPLGLGWIEKDVSLITSAYVEENHILRRQIADWQFQVKQGDSYRAELRARLEDTLKALYRAGKGESSTMLAHQLKHMSDDLNRSHERISHLTQELIEAQHNKNNRVDQLVDEYSSVQQARDDFIKEAQIKDRELQIKLQECSSEKQSLRSRLEKAEHDLHSCNRETMKQRQHLQEQSRVISNLRQELIRCDNQLESLKQRTRRQQHDTVNDAALTQHITEKSTVVRHTNAGYFGTMSDNARYSQTTQFRQGQGLDKSIESLDAHHSTHFTSSTPTRANSTGRMRQSRKAQSSSSGDFLTENSRSSARIESREYDKVTATPERDQTSIRRTEISHSPWHPPAVVRVRTSRSHNSEKVSQRAATPPSRRRPSLESIGSSSGEKPTYKSTRTSNSRK